MHKTIGDRLRRAREMVPKLSARELDRLAGRAEGHASLIEADQNPRPRADVLASYADVLGVSLDWLIRGEGEDPSAEVGAAVERARTKRVNDTRDDVPASGPRGEDPPKHAAGG